MKPPSSDEPSESYSIPTQRTMAARSPCKLRQEFHHLDPGDEILGSIELAATEQGWKNALVSGIGSVENPLLAHYRLDHKKYTEKRLSGIFEITSLQGNIAIFESKPLVHVHAALSDAEMKAFGGHLVEGYCSATAELVIANLDSKLTKSQNDLVGLKTWDLEAA